MVVSGPWPGTTMVSSGSARTGPCSERMIFSYEPPGRSVRPMEPANRVSPAISFFSGAKYRQMLPSVCPGVCSTSAVRLAGADFVSRADAAVDGHVLRSLHADPRGLHVEHLQQRVIVLVEQNGRTGEPLQLHRSANVIDVRVGDNNLLHGEAVTLDDAHDVRYVVSGIDDDSFLGLLIADHRAIALQRTDRKDLVNHGSKLSRMRRLFGTLRSQKSVFTTEAQKHGIESSSEKLK